MSLYIASHVQRHETQVLDAVLKMAAPIGKALDPQPAFWELVKAAIPGFKLIARFYLDGWQPPLQNPEAEAREFVERCKVQPGWGVADYIETPNEPISTSAGEDALRRYDRFMSTAVIQGHYAGKEVIVGNFGTGNFTPEEWRRYFPKTISVANCYGFHEYGWPRLWSQNYFEGDGHALRCIAVMQEIHKTAPHAKAFITECGATNAVTGGHDVGYLARPYATATPEAFWNDLAWYLGELSKHDFIESVHVFQTGGYKDWATFETVGTSIIGKMREWNLAQKEETMQYDRHRVYDTWARRLGDGGFNPNVAIDQAWQQHPEWGVPLGPAREEDPYIVREFANGIAYVRKGDWGNVPFARMEAELPPNS